MQAIQRSARKQARKVSGGNTSLSTFKRAAHRVNRSHTRRLARGLAEGTIDADSVDFEPVMIVGAREVD